MDMVAIPSSGFPQRFSVYLCNLDPTVGSEVNKKRPCVVISPDEINKYLRTVLIAPMTSTVKPYLSRVNCQFAGKSGQIMLDQIRSIDHRRVTKHLGKIDPKTQAAITERLLEMFS